MPAIRVEDSGHVYRNPSPNIWARHAFFPSIVELSPGELLASFDMGSAMENVDVRTYTSHSHDGGRTWESPTCIAEPKDLPYPVSMLGRVSRIQDGTLIGLILACNRSREDQGLANTHTEGYVETQFGIVESCDQGRTWSAPRWIVPPIEWRAFEICSPMVETSPDRWLLPTSIWRNWEGACTHGMKAVVFASENRGATWTRCLDVMNGRDRQIACWEQKHTKLSDGRWLVVCWAHDYRTSRSLNNHYTFSMDDGRSYGPMLESPLTGETCAPLALPDNHVLCVYRRVDRRGLWASLARIEKESWIPISDAPLWGAGVESYGAPSQNKMEEMSTLRFGYPQCIRLSDGDVFAVFWCVEDCVASIRWFRLQIEGL